jgi:DNA-binding transcriptional ArsR family regulator
MVQYLLNIADDGPDCYGDAMSRTLHHPTREQLDLPMVLDCLSDPIRLAIVYTLSQHERDGVELCCGDFSALSGKSNLTYHFTRLRESGVMHTRIVGTNRLMRLRREDLDACFPGLLDAVLKSLARDAARLRFSRNETIDAG